MPVTAIARSVAGLDIAHRGRQHAERDRHVAADQVIHQRRGAAIGHDLHVETGRGLEILGGEIAAGADRRGAEIELARILLRDRDHVGDGPGRKRRMRDQGDRHRGDQADRREILARVVAGIRVEARIDRDGAGVREHQRVAVGLGLGDRAGADRAAAAGAVLDDDLRLERADSFSATMRASASTPPPGGNGTTSVIGAARIVWALPGRRAERKHGQRRAAAITSLRMRSSAIVLELMAKQASLRPPQCGGRAKLGRNNHTSGAR